MSNPVAKPIVRIGQQTIAFFEEVGRINLLLARILRRLTCVIRDRGLIVEQMMQIGVKSLPLVAVIALFTGAVSAWQAAYQFEGFIPLTYLGSATSTAILIELGPVLTAIVVAGRVGASIAAELGTMKVTEQIDALESLAIDPIRYLAMPRVVAATAMLPVLVVFADTLAIMGSIVVGKLFLGVTPEVYIESMKRFFVAKNVWSGLVKALFFGASTSLVGCYVGFRTHGGAEGVGLATIRAFVLSSTMILLNDYVLAMILF